MKSIINNLIRELPADVETVAFPREAYLELLKEIDDLRDNAKSFTSVLEDADAALKAADYKLDQQATRIAQLTQWLESAENACREKDDEIARLKATNTRADNARAQRMAAMGCKTVYARNAKGNKLAAVEVPISADERVKALCAEVSRLETALDLEHNRYLEARREIARLNERLKESNNSLLDARQALTELNQAYERVRTTTQQLVKQKTALENQLNELKSADNRPTQECAAYPACAEQLEAEVAQLRQEKARITTRLENANKQIEGLQNTIETLRFRNNRLDTMASERHTSLAAELNRLRDELIKTRQDRDYWISLVRGVYNTTAVVADRK